MVKRRPFQFALAVAVVALAVWWTMSLFHRGPESTAKMLATAIRAEDWKGVFELTSERERELHGWNLERFKTFAIQLCGSFPESWGAFRTDDVTIYEFPAGVKPPLGGDPVRHRRYFVYFENGPRENGKLLKTSIGIRKGADGDWVADLSPLFLYLNKLKGGTRLDKLARLRSALASAGLTRMVSLDFNKQFSIETLDQALAGQVTEATTPFYGR